MSAHACVEPKSAQEGVFSLFNYISTIVETIYFGEISDYNFTKLIAFNVC